MSCIILWQQNINQSETRISDKKLFRGRRDIQNATCDCDMDQTMDV